jgi:phosphoribosylformimino-5-aminoimidazole carboxamide ribotide isomerase
MIQVIPAIDVIDGRCVRLTRGDFGRVSAYDASPLEVARRYVDAGFTTLHLVDLDGARAGCATQMDVLEAVAATGVAVQFGGGIQRDDDVRAAFDAGAARVIAGTVAVAEPSRVIDWLARFGNGRIVIAADAMNGTVRVDAWRRDAGLDVVEFIAGYARSGARWTLVTDIERDGVMAGPALDFYRRLRRALPATKLIASGGVSGIDDIHALADAGVNAVVIGKALLDGAIAAHDLEGFAC